MVVTRFNLSVDGDLIPGVGVIPSLANVEGVISLVASVNASLLTFRSHFKIVS